MTSPAAQGAAHEEPIPAANPVSGSNLPHNKIPRRWVKDAIRVLTDQGHAVSGAHAWRLIKEYRDWQADDARGFVAKEFGAYVQRRGDLIQPRTRRHFGVGETGWRTSS